MNFRIYIYREKIDYPNETEGNNDSSNEMNYKLDRVRIFERSGKMLPAIKIFKVGILHYWK